MDIYKLKFTKLQNEILRFLFIKSGKEFNLRRIALSLNVSLTAVSKALKTLADEVTVKKDKESKRLSITLNKNNPKVFALKRAENLKLISESGLTDCLSDKLPGATIILFGSYAFGEDIINSDIDIAVIGAKERVIDISGFEKILERNIALHFYGKLSDIGKNLRANILNGITLEGAVEL